MEIIIPENKIYNEEFLGKTKIGDQIIGIDLPQIIVINLVHRIDRHERVIQEMKKNHLPYSFFKTELHPDPIRGCLESHINIIKWAKSQNYKQICIFEDDFLIHQSLDQIPDFPENYDMIYLGGLCTEIHNQTNGWCKGRVYCNHAYIIKDSVFDIIIKQGWLYENELDRFYTEYLHTNFNAYVSFIQYVTQYKDYSDIDRRSKWENFNWPKPGDTFYIP